MKVVHEETMCCGYKRCAVVRTFDDGSVTITDDDHETGSVGTIKLRPDAAKRLAALILENK